MPASNHIAITDVSNSVPFSQSNNVSVSFDNNLPAPQNRNYYWPHNLLSTVQDAPASELHHSAPENHNIGSNDIKGLPAIQNPSDYGLVSAWSIVQQAANPNSPGFLRANQHATHHGIMNPSISAVQPGIMNPSVPVAHTNIMSLAMSAPQAPIAHSNNNSFMPKQPSHSTAIPPLPMVSEESVSPPSPLRALLGVDAATKASADRGAVPKRKGGAPKGSKKMRVTKQEEETPPPLWWELDYSGMTEMEAEMQKKMAQRKRKRWSDRKNTIRKKELRAKQAA
ncbi:hypothetical protein QBC40DRAFT_248753 [Triangularia verruculosa]|uniref:Uncharacterized protein n=1 Tax=Triangularia verruculosa TaxID=2587418 RepID=A0AAN6XRU2_9PEZI|nr:hypothetical protein QBC40DRAFT_248753 [Triangularia verruculosa]